MAFMRASIPCRCDLCGFVARIAALLLMLAPATAPRAMVAVPNVPQQVNSQARVSLQVSVVDENGKVVPSAHITLTPSQGAPVQGETDYAGRKEFPALLPGAYTLSVEKEGFFAVTQRDFTVGEAAETEVTLNHIREFSEQVDVVYSPP